MIDSHTHLESCEQSTDELLANARAAGITRILTIGLGVESSERALAAAAEYPEVFAAVGFHPNNNPAITDGELGRLAELAEHELCKAVGETGLDNFRDTATLEDQRPAFRGQIEIARKVGKPLVIHMRGDATTETLDILRREAAGLEVILHCFSIPDQIEECVAEGWWISFAGHVTYPKNTELAAAVAKVPADRLLVETDAPYLTPQPERKHRNQPAFVTHTAQFVAEQRDLTYAELDTLVTANAERVFGWGNG